MVILAPSMGRRRIVTIVLMGLATVLATAAVAGAAEPPRIFLGAGDGYAVVFKLEGETPSVLAAVATASCAVTAEEEGAETTVELEGFRAPTLLRPVGGGLKATYGTGGLYRSGSFAVEDVVFGTSVTGVLEGFHSGEGEPTCRTGDPAAPAGGPRVAFTATEYVPVTDPRAEIPPAAAVSFYYAKTPTLEAYMFMTSEYALAIRGRATLSCTGAAPKAIRRRLSLFGAPANAGLVRGDSFRLAQDSALLKGHSTGGAVSGTYRRHVAGRNRGGAWSCRTPATAYEAVRYVPAVGPPVS
jgi:hypothetical protein